MPLLPSPVLRLPDPVLARAGVELRLKRDDLIHPLIPGNKWRKLMPNLRAAVAEGHTRLLTFGGAYSNHIRAVAAGAAAYGLESVGLIRGDELADAPRNWSLTAAEADGMRLSFLDRRTYRATLSTLSTPETQRRLLRAWGRCSVLPEGGSNVLAARGAADTVRELLPDLGPDDVICCAVGTGGTLAGMAAALPPGTRALGVAALKGASGYLESEITRLHEQGWHRTFDNWQIHHTHHAGGYARTSPQLAAFAADFESRHGVALERHYVAKTLHCVYDLARTGQFPPGTRITLVVTGPATP
ncbi:1-aminocyclopropane-1-carboxylate deaminase/D-cysteine desulfhydrase [Streptomyces sp. NBC_01803]|uniref:1-aminocyclopropane-1-carboxylate deaminase/D-cysteine desulfhydrase n=1 Tax=Streptomyces sp. NBC_01803 TaxID=2975946 RepID=UPI002DD844F4|nr:pyridoxal-phosphate dependent enzyme [Streptomyces sp. NBC_01803]WSA44488.1 pyridoxal-phosphate dependent enzyme [Streptomyces sp. NBC_01803]